MNKKIITTILIITLIFLTGCKGDILLIQTSSGSSNTSIGNFTEGSIIFADTDGNLTEDNTNLFFNDTTDRLGLGTNDPSAQIDVASSALFNSDKGVNDFIVEGDTDIRLFYGSSTFNKLAFAVKDTFTMKSASPRVSFRDDTNSITTDLLTVIQNPTTEGSGRTMNIRGETSASVFDIRQFGTGNMFYVGKDNNDPAVIVNNDGALIIDNQITNSVPLVIKGAISQSSDLLNIVNSNNDELVVVASDGDVGIGTDTPTHKLTMYKTDSAPIIKLIREDSTIGTGNAFGALYFDGTDGGVSTSGSPAGILGIAGESQSASHKGGTLTFQTKNINTATGQPATEKMRITSEGRVGIGTISPTSILHVNGNLTVEGNINVSGCIIYNGGTLGSCI